MNNASSTAGFKLENAPFNAIGSRLERLVREFFALWTVRKGLFLIPMPGLVANPADGKHHRNLHKHADNGREGRT